MTRRKHYGEGWREYEIPAAPADARTYDDMPLFAPVVPAARKGDPETSNDGIAAVLPRAGSQQLKLLLAYASRPMGLTNEEAAELAGLNTVGTCYWKRCGELLRANLITYVGITRKASTGADQRVHAITEKGQLALGGSK